MQSNRKEESSGDCMFWNETQIEENITYGVVDLVWKYTAVVGSKPEISQLIMMRWKI